MTAKATQNAFFRQLADPQALRMIFDHLPEVYFFTKDRKGRIMSASAAILGRLGMRSEADFIGRTDYSVFPRVLADSYAADDALVFRTAKPLVNRLELWLDPQGQPDWCVTTKVPLYGKSGQVVGLMGVSHHDSRHRAVQPAAIVTRALAYLRENISRLLSTAELARAAGTSERTLNRKVNEAYGIPPYELMLRTRVQMAAEAMLHSSESIASVAQDHGFCDQSAFTQHFRKRMGVTPRQFIRGRRG